MNSIQYAKKLIFDKSNFSKITTFKPVKIINTCIGARGILFLILVTLSLVLLSCTQMTLHNSNIELPMNFISETYELDSFPILQDKQAACICVDQSDYTGVLRAANDLQLDIERVSSVKPELFTDDICF